MKEKKDKKVKNPKKKEEAGSVNPIVYAAPKPDCPDCDPNVPPPVKRP